MESRAAGGGSFAHEDKDKKQKTKKIKIAGMNRFMTPPYSRIHIYIRPGREKGVITGPEP
jgi:hypothetical protein